MKIKLIAFDLDGTFLDDNKDIVPENMAAIEAAARRGIEIVPATGRIFDGLPEAVRNLPFVRYYLTVNGSYVYDAKEDIILNRAEISPELADRFYEYVDSLGYIYDCYQENWGFMSSEMLKKAPEYVTNAGILRLVKTLRTPVDDLRTYLRELGKPIQKLQVYLGDIDQNEKRRIMAEMAEKFPEFRITSSVACNIEVNSRDASKGQALSALCNKLGIPIEQTMAFGDGTNDLDMITAAGFGVAMGNGEEEVRAAADYVTCDNNHAGVAYAIYRMLDVTDA